MNIYNNLWTNSSTKEKYIMTTNNFFCAIQFGYNKIQMYELNIAKAIPNATLKTNISKIIN